MSMLESMNVSGRYIISKFCAVMKASIKSILTKYEQLVHLNSSKRINKKRFFRSLGNFTVTFTA